MVKNLSKTRPAASPIVCNVARDRLLPGKRPAQGRCPQATARRSAAKRLAMVLSYVPFVCDPGSFCSNARQFCNAILLPETARNLRIFDGAKLLSCISKFTGRCEPYI